MLDRLRKISWPWRRPEPEGIVPGARTVPAGVLVFDGENKDLWWVKVILNVGRPVVAVIVLVMCAPGEHHLAVLAGWSDWLAWGMPATLTAYAGIAAVVATKRPKKTPGKKTAVAGAIISVMLAMGAQPISHLYEQQLITGYEVPLTIVVSCIPALVFGHLLHMAAAPVGDPVGKSMLTMDRPEPGDYLTDETDPEDTYHYGDAMTYRGGDEDGMDAGLDSLRGHRPDLVIVDETTAAVPQDTWRDRLTDHVAGLESPTVDGIPVRYPTRQDALDMINRPTPAPDTATLTGYLASVHVPGVPDNGGYMTPADLQTAASVSRGMSTGDNPLASQNGQPGPVSVPPDVQPVVRSPRPRRTTGITARVRTMLEENPYLTNDEIKDKCSGDNPDSVKKSIARVRRERGE